MRMFPQYTHRKPLQLVAQRPFSTERAHTPASLSNEPPGDIAEKSEEIPWFLEEDAPRHPPSQHKANLPKVPEDAPAMLNPMLKYVYEDMGLDDISMLDVRDLDPPASLGANLIMLFATTRSERHLHVSSGRFVRWLRRNYNLAARAEGLIGSGELKTKLRRLRKKAKLMGHNTAMIPGGDNGISTGWVCVNFRTKDGAASDEASYDESGSFSGFGASQSGTTIVVQCMTEARRQELDLETLWKGILRRNLDQQAKIRGEPADAAKLDEMLASKLQLHAAPGASQWDAMKRASQQHRYFSTSARRLQSPDEPGTSKTPASSVMITNQGQEHYSLEVDTWGQGLVDVLIKGAPMDQARLEQLVSDALGAPLTDETTAGSRLALIDQILQTGEERGLKVRSKSMFVTLVESLATSPAYGPELGRAQKNCEMLLTETEEPLELEEVGRLMNAYASRRDWDRFWDIFRNPTRFNLPRLARLYELAFRTMASTKDAKLCTEALRWVYPEMLMEKPPVKLGVSLSRALKSCILVADPAAEELLHNPPPQLNMAPIQIRSLENREFVKVLREVEALLLNVGSR